MAFYYQNRSDLMRRKNVLLIKKNFCKFTAEEQEFVKFLRPPEQFI